MTTTIEEVPIGDPFARIAQLEEALQRAHREIVKLQEEIAAPHRRSALTVLTQYDTLSRAIHEWDRNIHRIDVALVPRVATMSMAHYEVIQRGPEAQRYVKHQLSRELAAKLVEDWEKQGLFGVPKT